MFYIALYVVGLALMSLLFMAVGIMINDRQGLGLWVKSDRMEDYDIRKLRLYRCCTYLFIIILGTLWHFMSMPSWIVVILSSVVVAAGEAAIRKFAVGGRGKH